ncbi:MAG: tetratricopeptide repeat protein [Egibacteraceae bacterium]
MERLDDALADLRSRVRRYEPERYPVQHATARFHLGAALLQDGRAAAAAAELSAAVAGFRAAGMAVEHAKATMMLGVALRETGRGADAARAFSAAAAAFAEHEQRGEHAAALHNLGLVARDGGDLDRAIEAFTRAVEGFTGLGEATARTSANRELGTTLLAAGRPEEAVGALRRAVDDSPGRTDAVAWGAAANALGLALLALARHDEAAEAFSDAATAHPRGLRPDGHAMAKANLALAHEGAGRAAHARLAARQARDTDGAPPVVAAQAVGLLERIAEVPGELGEVLDAEAADRWAPILRDELGRWLGIDGAARAEVASGWIACVLARRGRAPDLLEAWFGVALEQPPADMEALLTAVVTAWRRHGAQERERFRSAVSRALPRFHLPQWQRLQHALERLSAATGEEVEWR